MNTSERVSETFFIAGAEDLKQHHPDVWSAIENGDTLEQIKKDFYLSKYERYDDLLKASGFEPEAVNSMESIK